MRVDRLRLFQRAESARRESKLIDFKAEFDPSSNAAWCEIIKDIVSFANSGGGVIVFGLNNDGTPSNADLTALLSVDIADVTNKIARYTDSHFAEMELTELRRGNAEMAALVVLGVDVPLVFTRPGTYDIGNGKQKNAFSQGVVYFRHGAKSEPATRDDLRNWLGAAIEKVRKGWLGGIRKVVEAPPGHDITVVASPARADVSMSDGMAITATVTSEPGALRVVPLNAEEIWPFRQKELLNEINREVKASPPVNGHDILCINTHLDVLNSKPEFAYKPHRLASPQYSAAYAKWIAAQFKADPEFFSRIRSEYKNRNSH